MENIKTLHNLTIIYYDTLDYTEIQYCKHVIHDSESRECNIQPLLERDNNLSRNTIYLLNSQLLYEIESDINFFINQQEIIYEISKNDDFVKYVKRAFDDIINDINRHRNKKKNVTIDFEDEYIEDVGYDCHALTIMFYHYPRFKEDYLVLLKDDDYIAITDGEHLHWKKPKPLLARYIEYIQPASKNKKWDIAEKIFKEKNLRQNVRINGNYYDKFDKDFDELIKLLDPPLC